MKVAAVRTPLAVRDAYDAIATACGDAPLRAVDIVVAQACFEGGWFRETWNFNPFNHRPGPGEDYCERDCGENVPRSLADAWVKREPDLVSIDRIYVDSDGTTKAAVAIKAGSLLSRFKVYRSFDEAIGEHISQLRTRYASAWARAMSGDVDGYAERLKTAGYYTADVATYKRTLRGVLDILPIIKGEAPMPSNTMTPELKETLRVRVEAVWQRLVRIAYFTARQNGSRAAGSGSRMWLEPGAHFVAWTCMMTLRMLRWLSALTGLDGFPVVTINGETFGDDWTKKVAAFDPRLMDRWGTKYGGVGGKAGAWPPPERAMAFCTGQHVGMVCFVDDLGNDTYRVYTCEGGQVDGPAGTTRSPTLTWELLTDDEGAPLGAVLREETGGLDDHERLFVHTWRYVDGKIPGYLSVATCDGAGVLVLPKPAPAPPPLPPPLPPVDAPAPPEATSAPPPPVDAPAAPPGPAARPQRPAVAAILLGLLAALGPAGVVAHCALTDETAGALLGDTTSTEDESHGTIDAGTEEASDARDAERPRE